MAGRGKKLKNFHISLLWDYYCNINHIFMSARDGSSKHHTTMHWNLSTSMTWTKYDQSMSVFLHTR
jgi:hypothetical protein